MGLLHLENRIPLSRNISSGCRKASCRAGTAMTMKAVFAAVHTLNHMIQSVFTGKSSFSGEIRTDFVIGIPLSDKFPQRRSA